MRAHIAVIHTYVGTTFYTSLIMITPYVASKRTLMGPPTAIDGLCIYMKTVRFLFDGPGHTMYIKNSDFWYVFPLYIHITITFIYVTNDLANP